MLLHLQAQSTKPLKIITLIPQIARYRKSRKLINSSIATLKIKGSSRSLTTFKTSNKLRTKITSSNFRSSQPLQTNNHHASLQKIIFLILEYKIDKRRRKFRSCTTKEKTAPKRRTLASIEPQMVQIVQGSTCKQNLYLLIHPKKLKAICIPIQLRGT